MALIAEFEKTFPSTHVRGMITREIRNYDRMPQFKTWKARKREGSL